MPQTIGNNQQIYAHNLVTPHYQVIYILMPNDLFYFAFILPLNIEMRDRRPHNIILIFATQRG